MARLKADWIGSVEGNGRTITEAREQARRRAARITEHFSHNRTRLVVWGGYLSLVFSEACVDGSVVWGVTSPRTMADLDPRTVDCTDALRRAGTGYGHWANAEEAASAALAHCIQLAGPIPAELPSALTTADRSMLESLRRNELETARTLASYGA